MKKLIALIFAALLLVGFAWVNNNWIVTTEYSVQSEKVPDAFSGKRIVQVSDLHNAEFGDQQQALLEKVEAANPDVIFITGDLIDSNRYDLERSLAAVDGLVEMSEVYYVIGNHEVSSNRLDDEIVPALEERGVEVLRNRSVMWEENGEAIQIAGIDDPLMDIYLHEEEFTRNSIAEAGLNDAFTLLLAHRPEQLDTYASEGIDVVFSGHAHGGQIRIPGLGGLIAPGQGWFPAMTEGVFESGDTQLVLSRGLGNSGFPLRVFNLPEVVVVTLENE
ncbi:metallophosphoesterase [Planococcus sp. CP5-4]|uniref:metallophosphoesterase n=1 Tax=unclassified Planococcus (in: firmicutes) TaxID=2662419 RepID=UPI001C23D346|nr:MULTISPECIES: metallophosphoesterase [unclassified Planococcus (in: firmicutes)]MBU9673196.1 metallophosphoesterase [Planococcus sp. CP5-4_YE]MBW6062504.1 metallophosphoesterase [Planococcus sp. CP5-4]